MFSVVGGYDYAALLALTVLLSLFIGRRYGAVFGVTAAWTFFSALRVFAAPESPYAGEGTAWRASLSLAAASALVCIGLSVAAGFLLSVRFWQAVAVLNAAMLLFGEGLLQNYSMSGCLAACLLPWTYPWGIGPVLISRQSQPIALLFVTAGAYFVRRRQWCRLALAAPLSLAVGTLSRHALFSTNGRFEVWCDAYEFFKDHVNPWIGAGLGTFHDIGPFLTVKKYGQGFVTLHSDWLQILFETGIPGALAAFVLFAHCLYKGRRDEKRSTALLCFGCFGIANFPLHNPISATFGAWLMISAIVPKGRRRLHPSCQA